MQKILYCKRLQEQKMSAISSSQVKDASEFIMTKTL